MTDPITGQAPVEEQATPEQREAALDADFAAVGAATEPAVKPADKGAEKPVEVAPTSQEPKTLTEKPAKPDAGKAKTPDDIQAEIDAQVAAVQSEQDARTVAEAAERLRQEAADKAKQEAEAAAKAKPATSMETLEGVAEEVMAEIAAMPSGQNAAFDAYGFNSAEGDGKNLLKAVTDVAVKIVAKALAKAGPAGAVPEDIEKRIHGVEQHISKQQMERAHDSFMDALGSEEYGGHTDARDIEVSPEWAEFVKEQPEHIVKALGGQGFTNDDAGAAKHLKFTGSIIQLFKLKKGITGKPAGGASKSRVEQLREERARQDAIHRNTSRGGSPRNSPGASEAAHLTEEEQEEEFKRIARENESRQPKPWK